jgi:hypothetical protein
MRGIAVIRKFRCGENMPTSIYYHFKQHFNTSAGKAYEWCTNYTPGDHALMGESDVTRKIDRLTERTVILTDTFNMGAKSQVEKQKLVQLYPETLLWTSTHISGPAKHSQFIYQIIAEGDDSSHLDFTGLFLDYAHGKMIASDIMKLAEKTCKEDAATWALLAKAMEQSI